MQLFGGIDYSVDGNPIDYPKSVAYKSLMLSGVPNFAYAIGYTNSSWTLKIGLICEHLCRIMQHMTEQDQLICQPELPDPNMPTRPLLDFGAGYVQRAIDNLPRRGMSAPWDVAMDYKVDAKNLRLGSVTDDCLKFYASAKSPVKSSDKTKNSTKKSQTSKQKKQVKEVAEL